MQAENHEPGSWTRHQRAVLQAGAASALPRGAPEPPRAGHGAETPLELQIPHHKGVKREEFLLVIYCRADSV